MLLLFFIVVALEVAERAVQALDKRRAASALQLRKSKIMGNGELLEFVRRDTVFNKQSKEQNEAINKQEDADFWVSFRVCF